MRKLLFLPLLLLIAACGSTTTPEVNTATENSDAVETAAPADTTGSDSSENETAAGESSQAANEPVVTGSTPEEASIVRVQDHVKGTSEPTVTIIEYGDFQ